MKVKLFSVFIFVILLTGCTPIIMEPNITLEKEWQSSKGIDNFNVKTLGLLQSRGPLVNVIVNGRVKKHISLGLSLIVPQEYKNTPKGTLESNKPYMVATVIEVSGNDFYLDNTVAIVNDSEKRSVNCYKQDNVVKERGYLFAKRICPLYKEDISLLLSGSAKILLGGNTREQYYEDAIQVKNKKTISAVEELFRNSDAEYYDATLEAVKSNSQRKEIEVIETTTEMQDEYSL